MPKKIIDISPPLGAKPQAKPPKIKMERREEKKPRSFLRWKILVIFLIIFGGIILIQINSRLTLKIQPYLEPLSFEETFEVRVDAESINLEEKIIPGRFFEEDVEKSEQFRSTGLSQEVGKAQGKIQVFNSHSPSTPITLRAGTRFLSSDNGKIFRSPEKIYLPAAKIIQGKAVPSSVEITVEAQEAGENYNIGPSNFSLPGLAGNPLYYTIYAESQSSMSGGFVKEVKIVSAEDIANAQDSLLRTLFREANDFLRNRISEDFVLLEKAVSEEESDVRCLQKSGGEYVEFSCQGNIKIKGLGFKLSDLKALSGKFVAKIISPSEKLVEGSLNFEYLSQNLILEKGKMILDLKIEGATYKDIPIETLKEQVEGKSKEEIREIILNNYPQIESTSVKFWPFWMKKAPKTSERIKIELISNRLTY